MEFTGEIRVDKTPAHCFSGDDVLTKPINFMYFRQFEWIGEKTFISKIENGHALVRLQKNNFIDSILGVVSEFMNPRDFEAGLYNCDREQS